jgi:hypothetical protein
MQYRIINTENMTLNQLEPRKDRGAAGRLNTATKGGVLGMIAGKVKFRDEMLVAAAAVLIATSVWKSQGLLVGIAVVKRPLERNSSGSD